MSELKIYKISEKYIDFLREVDPVNVKLNKEESRPYIGVVLDVYGYRYFAPLASPKPKHKKMKTSLDFIKIEDGRLGVINLNNMIPVVEEALITFDIAQEEEKYRNLLYGQLKFLHRNKNMICEKAKRLYISVVKYHSYLEARCAHFKALEEKSRMYSPEKE